MSSQRNSALQSFKKNIQGISPKVLSQKLKMLDEMVYPKTSPKYLSIRVDYSLTSLGHEVAKMAFQLKDWAETNIEKVISAQQKFDSSPKQEKK
jgi:DNA-binding HxlR family transcriptional regulator